MKSKAPPAAGTQTTGDKERHDPGKETSAEAMVQCLRCHQVRPLVEDGFCGDCLKAMEDACL